MATPRPDRHRVRGRLIRGIPDGLWESAKRKAADQDLTISDVVKVLLQRWLADDSERPLTRPEPDPDLPPRRRPGRPRKKP